MVGKDHFISSLEVKVPEMMKSPKTGGCYLFTGCKTPPQSKHNCFELDWSWNLDKSFLASEETETYI